MVLTHVLVAQDLIHEYISSLRPHTLGAKAAVEERELIYIRLAIHILNTRAHTHTHAHTRTYSLTHSLSLSLSHTHTMHVKNVASLRACMRP